MHCTLNVRRGISMQFLRRQFLTLAAGALVLPALPQTAPAESYPSRPVHVIVGFAAGGPADSWARLMAQWLSDRLGQQFVVENRPGGGGNIATEAVVAAPADGYTLLLIGINNVLNIALYDKLNFDFMRDIVPVAGLNRGYGVLEVHPSLAVKSVPEFIAYAKANPGKISYASGGNGSAPHLYGELFKVMAGVDLVHIPYRGGAPAVLDLLSGQVPAMFDNLGTSLEYIRSGKLRALAVTSPARLEVLPDIPTIGDFVPGFAASGWNGFGAPRNTQPEIIERLNREINAGLSDRKFKDRLAQFNNVSLSMTPAEFGSFMAEETEKWGKVIRAAHIKAE
jgi:tripartite-type tricarboxylate transporter receptor subunit TctC